MTELRKRYEASTLRILGLFQLVEFVLKHYIGFAYQLIQKRLDGAIQFDYSIQDVENHPLERLLSVFSKLNDNIELQKKLNSLRAKRNHVAHKSLILSMGRSYDASALEKADEEFFYLEDEVQECLVELKDELRDIKRKLCDVVA